MEILFKSYDQHFVDIINQDDINTIIKLFINRGINYHFRNNMFIFHSKKDLEIARSIIKLYKLKYKLPNGKIADDEC